jgi:hypothetical protein
MLRGDHFRGNPILQQPVQGEKQHSQSMTFSDLASVPSHAPAPFTDQLRLAVAAYLARFQGCSREHTETDQRCYLA